MIPLFVVINISNKKMSSKLLGSLQTRLNRVFDSKFVTVWLDSLYRVPAEFLLESFLSPSETDILLSNVRELHTHNFPENPNYWVTCLPYLEKINGELLPVDYVILGKLHPSYFDSSDLFINSEELEKDLYCAWYSNLIVTDDD